MLDILLIHAYHTSWKTEYQELRILRNNIILAFAP